ncbi:potassium voltage-gated channel subfamily A member 1-like [Mercenaria mercenaria]|uniref:potassium voltage-gated channel subfamily A member 1-like n=1 Tax=Mercenaria mercenaria TaxID=6596 RepID=UPI00234F08BD|nr:potassium voltage-gated channel subfamily A member 1-like [Mercenaria mercenaria]
MHFVARNSTDAAYQSQGYTLRADPLVLFRQPPTTIHGSPISTHRRTHSGGSIKLAHYSKQNNNDIELNALEPLISHEEKEATVPEGDGDDVCSEHDCELEHCKRIIINVAGLKFETQLKTLNRLPTTLLGNPNKRDKYWISATNEYFFDRHRPSFPAILYYYQSGGRLKRPVEVPVDIFLEELEFYQLGDSVIDAFKVSEGFILENDDIPMPEQKVKRFIWEVFEYPGSSLISNIVAIISVAFILTSIVTFCVETLPQFKNKDCTNVSVYDEDGNVTSVKKFNYLDPLFIIESCCITWFVFEIVVRFIVCPSKIKFLKNIVNWIDLLSIAPYFVFLVVFFITNSCQNNSRFLSVLRVLRVARIFKLSRFSDGLQILAKTMQVSLRELSMFVLFLSIAVVIFAGAIFYAEAQSEESFFTSIPDAFWWAVISMTTVGYGDVYPTGTFGKIIGSMCVLSGLLAIALPVPVIVTNFNNIYRQTTGRGNHI